MRIFITGATGFIGHHTVPLLLQDGHEVLVLSRQTLLEGVGTIRGDLSCLSQFKERICAFCPEVCVHLAWEGLPDYSYKQSKRNFDYSMQLFEFLVNETSCRKIVGSGSAWEYGKSHGVCHEEEQVCSTSYFTWAKQSLHTGGALLCQEKKVDFIWLRIFFAFGPHQRSHSLIPTLYRAFKSGENPAIKTPFNAQDFIYISDVAEAFRKAVSQPLHSGIYNVGRETAVPVSTVCALVAKHMLKPSIEYPLSDSLINTWADTSKLRYATGWCPQVGLEEGIARHIKFLETS